MEMGRLAGGSGMDVGESGDHNVGPVQDGIFPAFSGRAERDFFHLL